MRGDSAKVVVGLLLGIGVCAASSGCAENDSTLFVVGVAKPESDCTYSPSISSTFLPRGSYDVGFNGSYQVGLILANQMASRGVKTRSRTETSRIVLEGAEVSVLEADGSLFPLGQNPFTAPGAGFVDVGSGNDPGYGVLSVVVIPIQDEEVQPLLAKEGYVIAEIKAFGHTLGGQEVESNVFRFPIQTCYGCLVTFPVLNNAGECMMSATTETTATPCFWGQDTEVVCSSCAASFDVCVDPAASLGG